MKDCLKSRKIGNTMQSIFQKYETTEANNFQFLTDSHRGLLISVWSYVDTHPS